MGGWRQDSKTQGGESTSRTRGWCSGPRLWTEKEMLDSWGTVASEGQTKGQEPSMETRKWSERKEKGQRAVTRPGNVKGRSN